MAASALCNSRLLASHDMRPRPSHLPSSPHLSCTFPLAEHNRQSCDRLMCLCDPLCQLLLPPIPLPTTGWGGLLQTRPRPCRRVEGRCDFSFALILARSSIWLQSVLAPRPLPRDPPPVHHGHGRVPRSCGETSSDSVDRDHGAQRVPFVYPRLHV